MSITKANPTSNVGVTVSLANNKAKSLADLKPLVDAQAVEDQEDDGDVDLSSLADVDGEDEDETGEDDTPESSGATESETDESLDPKQVDNGVLEIYKPKCLGCSHLVPHLDTKFSKCHFSKGNDRCPASSVQILVGIPLDKIVRAFLVAEQTGDNARMGRLYGQLAVKPAWQQQRITEALAEARAAAKPKKAK